MKPPKCSLCKKNSRSHPEERFKLLYFKLTPAQTDRHSEIVNAGKVGHKPGAHWFCAADRQRAKPLTHMTWADAKKELMKESNPKSFWTGSMGRIGFDRNK